MEQQIDYWRRLAAETYDHHQNSKAAHRRTLRDLRVYRLVALAGWVVAVAALFAGA